MKKTFKRLGAALLAMAMAVSVLCTGALAADTYSITIKSDTTHTLGLNHTFNAYQIFAGTLTADSTGTTSDDQKLGITDWGSNIKKDTTDHSVEFLSKLKSETTFGSGESNVFYNCETAADVAKVLSGWTGNNATTNAANTKKFAQVVATLINSYSEGDACKTAAGTTSTPLQSDGSMTATQTADVSMYKIGNLNAGYYLVADMNTSGTGEGKINLDKDDAYSAYMLQVAGNVEVVTKSDVPTVDKKIIENKTEKTETTAKVGDVVNFRLTGTLPDNYGDYTTYKYVFHDTLSKGLSYNGDVKVYVKNGDAELVEIEGYSVTSTGATSTTPTDATDITVTFENLKATTVKAKDTNTTVTIDKNSKIIVEYSATLNENAVVGGNGNKNTVNIEYSNDPNGSSTGTTTDKEVTVYTFLLNVNKVDGTNNSAKLSGAGFKLYYETTEGETTTKHYAIVNTTAGENQYKITSWITEADKATTLTTNDDGQIIFKGLKEGTYYLEEITAPTGYNKLTNPVKVEIEKDSTTIKKLESVKADGTNGTVNEAEGTITIANNKGSNLPSTGGMGTTLFYIIGGVLMAGAAVVLVIKKKRSSAE